MINKKWHKNKRLFIPISIVFGFTSGIWLSGFLSKRIRDDFTADYYHKKEAPIFIKKGSVSNDVDESK